MSGINSRNILQESVISQLDRFMSLYSFGNTLSVNAVGALEELLAGYIENHSTIKDEIKTLDDEYLKDQTEKIEKFKNGAVDHNQYFSDKKDRDLLYAKKKFGILNRLMSKAGIHPLQDSGDYGESTEIEEIE